MSPLSFLPFQPPFPWPRSQRPCVKRLVTCTKGNCLLCAGSPASGLVFTCYLVLPPLRYPWKTRLESNLPALPRAHGRGGGRGGASGREVLGCSLRARTETPPPNPPGWSVQEPSAYREARKKLGSEKMKRSAEVPRHLPRRGAGARAVMGHRPTAGLSLQTLLKS